MRDVIVAFQRKTLNGRMVNETPSSLETIITQGAVRRPMPQWVPPQLALLEERPPAGDKWLHEVKFDGYRIFSYREKDGLRLVTRNNLDWTAKLNNVAQSVGRLPGQEFILDGEICLLDSEGKASFKLLQQHLKQLDSSPIVYFVFDILYLDGWDLRRVRLIERKRILSEFMSRAFVSSIIYTDHQLGRGGEVFETACSLQWEGVISKHIDSVSTPGRQPSWVKSKCVHEEEFIIVGYTPHSSLSNQIGALLLGQWSISIPRKLRYCGKVGTGFSAKERAELFTKLSREEVSVLNISGMPQRAKNVHWVRPMYVAQIVFTEWTRDRILRHPSFQGLRFDKSASEVQVSPGAL